MKAAAFAYVRARSVDELFDLLDQHGPDSQILAGGQSLLATLNMRLSQPSVLIDIAGIEALRGILRDGALLSIGALARHREVERSAEVAAAAPLLALAMPHVAHAAIRNRGTLGGSIALADPSAELPACMLALDATIRLRGRAGERRVPAAGFFKGLFETDLRAGEIVAGVDVPAIAPGWRAGFAELARRHGDYAIVGLAAMARVEETRISEARLAWFGVDVKPLATPGVAAALVADGIDAARAAIAGELDPPEDLHGDGAMKRHLAGVLLGRVVAQITETPA